MMALTVKDASKIRISTIKKKGACISFKFSADLCYSERPKFLSDIKELFRDNGITLSGFGLERFGGIISTSLSESRFKTRIIYLRKVLGTKFNHLDKLSIGRVQWVEDIWFE